MDIKKLNKVVKEVHEDLGEALVSTDIWSVADGQSIAGYNSNPKAAALMNRVGQQFIDSLIGADFRSLDKYYILDLKDGKLMICLLCGDYHWGMLLDAEKVHLGLLLNVVTPKCINGVTEALSK